MSNYMHASRAESYGSVNLRRRRGANASNKSNDHDHPTHASTTTLESTKRDFHHTGTSRSQKKSELLVYKYNHITATFIVPSLSLVYSQHHSPAPLLVSLYGILILYGFDLSGSQPGYVFGIWTAFGAVLFSFVLEHYLWNYDDVWGSTGLFFDGILLFCTTCWGNLQLEWLHRDWDEYGQSMETTLHTLLPIASAVTITRTLVISTGFVDVAPFLASLVLSHGISKLGGTSSSYVHSTVKEVERRYAHTVKDDEETKHFELEMVDDIEYAVPEWIQNYQFASLLWLPSIIYIWQCSSSISSTDFVASKELSSLSLTISTSYIMLYHIKRKRQQNLGQDIGSQNPLHIRRALVAYFVAFLSFQYRYLMPLSVQISDFFGGRDSRSPLSTTVWFSCGLLCLVGVIWLSKKKMADGAPLFGKRLDEMCTLGVFVSLLIMEVAFPLPYDVALLGALSMISMGKFVLDENEPATTISMFVNCTNLVLALYQRSFFAERHVSIIPGLVHAPLSKFCFPPNLLIGVWFMIRSVKTRKSNAMHLGQISPHTVTKTFDSPGLMLLLFSCVLVVVESAMHFHSNGETHTTSYPKYFIWKSSVVLLLLILKLRKDSAITNASTNAIGSVTVGKVLAIMTDADSSGSTQDAQKSFFVNILIWITFCVAIAFPYFAFTPIAEPSKSFAKISKYQRLPVQLESSSFKVVACYCGVILPLAISFVVPTLFPPAIQILLGENYYKTSLSYAEYFGYSSLTWGGITLSFLRYYLPEGGLLAFRKIACAAVVQGALFSMMGHNTPFSLDSINRNVFLSISSIAIGSSAEQRNGAWGLVSATSSVILSFTGILKLSPNRKRASEKSMGFKVHPHVIFSLFFGSGLAWFVMNQLIGETAYGEYLRVSLSTSLIGFLYTFASVKINFEMDGKNELEVVRNAHKTIATSSAITLFAIFFDVVASRNFEGFRPGGLHNVNLIALSIFLSFLSFTANTNMKKSRELVQLTNISSVMAWLVANTVIYSSFGLVGEGVQSTYKFLGPFPISIILTGAVSLLLGNYNLSNRGRIVSKRVGFGPKVSLGIVERSSASKICIFGTLSVLILTSIYAIFLRGFLGEVYTHHDFLLESNGHMKNVEILAQRFMTHKENAKIASRLAACSFWTSDHKFGPLKHFIGVSGPIIEWHIMYARICGVQKTGTLHYRRLGTFIDIITIIFFRGIPSLSVAALLCTCTSMYGVLTTSTMKQKSKMRL